MQQFSEEAEKIDNSKSNHDMSMEFSDSGSGNASTLSKQKAKMLLQKDKGAKQMWVQRVSKIQAPSPIVPTGIKKRVVARRLSKRKPADQTFDIEQFQEETKNIEVITEEPEKPEKKDRKKSKSKREKIHDRTVNIAEIMKRRQSKKFSQTQSPQALDLAEEKSPSITRSRRRSEESLKNSPQQPPSQAWPEEQKEKIDLRECKLFDDQMSSINGDQESEFGKTFQKMSPFNRQSKGQNQAADEQDKNMMSLMNDMDGSLEMEMNGSSKRVLQHNPSFQSIDLSVIQAPQNEENKKNAYQFSSSDQFRDSLSPTKKSKVAKDQKNDKAEQRDRSKSLHSNENNSTEAAAKVSQRSTPNFLSNSGDITPKSVDGMEFQKSAPIADASKKVAKKEKNKVNMNKRISIKRPEKAVNEIQAFTESDQSPPQQSSSAANEDFHSQTLSQKHAVNSKEIHETTTQKRFIVEESTELRRSREEKRRVDMNAIEEFEKLEREIQRKEKEHKQNSINSNKFQSNQESFQNTQTSHPSHHHSQSQQIDISKRKDTFGGESSMTQVLIVNNTHHTQTLIQINEQSTTSRNEAIIQTSSQNKSHSRTLVTKSTSHGVEVSPMKMFDSPSTAQQNHKKLIIQQSSYNQEDFNAQQRTRDSKQKSYEESKEQMFQSFAGSQGNQNLRSSQRGAINNAAEEDEAYFQNRKNSVAQGTPGSGGNRVERSNSNSGSKRGQGVQTQTQTVAIQADSPVQLRTQANRHVSPFQSQEVVYKESPMLQYSSNTKDSRRATGNFGEIADFQSQLSNEISHAKPTIHHKNVQSQAVQSSSQANQASNSSKSPVRMPIVKPLNLGSIQSQSAQKQGHDQAKDRSKSPLNNRQASGQQELSKPQIMKGLIQGKGKKVVQVILDESDEEKPPNFNGTPSSVYKLSDSDSLQFNESISTTRKSKFGMDASTHKNSYANLQQPFLSNTTTNKNSYVNLHSALESQFASSKNNKKSHVNLHQPLDKDYQKGKNQFVSQINLRDMGDGEISPMNTKKSYLLKKPTPITHKLTETDQQLLIDQIRNSEQFKHGQLQEGLKEVFPTDPYKDKKSGPITFDKRLRAERPQNIRDQFSGSTKLW